VLICLVQVTLWQNALNLEIERSNTIALKNGSRVPEVVEWYYHHQTELVHSTRVLENKMKAIFVYAGPGRNGNIKNSAVTLLVRPQVSFRF
jgi:hypothetical protein